jgi:hypothetical protein
MEKKINKREKPTIPDIKAKKTVKKPKIEKTDL